MAHRGVINSDGQIRPIWVEQRMTDTRGPLPPLSPPQYQPYSNPNLSSTMSHPQQQQQTALYSSPSHLNCGYPTNNVHTNGIDHNDPHHFNTFNNDNRSHHNASMMTAISSSTDCTMPIIDRYNSNNGHNHTQSQNSNQFGLNLGHNQQQQQQQNSQFIQPVLNLPLIDSDFCSFSSQPIKNSKRMTKTKQKKQRNVRHLKTVSIEEYKKKVQPWWIGQRIIVQTVNDKSMSGRIKDYDVEDKKVQVWYDNDESTFEWVDLGYMNNWNVADTKKICEYSMDYKYKIKDFIPKKYDFEPIKYDLLQRIIVKYRDNNWYTAFIDGFDPLSRRHHIQYGDTSEWLWITKDRIKAINGPILDKAEELRSEIEKNGNFAKPIPFDPEPYGLNEEFIKYSMHKSKDDKKKKKSKKRKKNLNDCKIPKRKKQKKIKKKSMYPRSVSLNGIEWKRSYSNEEKKYFWSAAQNGQNEVKSSWNPWHEIGKVAPWMKRRQNWSKFKDDDGKPYWYNYDEKTSTYERPKDFVSDVEIDHDSMEDS